MQANLTTDQILERAEKALSGGYAEPTPAPIIHDYVVPLPVIRRMALAIKNLGDCAAKACVPMKELRDGFNLINEIIPPISSNFKKII